MDVARIMKGCGVSKAPFIATNYRAHAAAFHLSA